MRFCRGRRLCWRFARLKIKKINPHRFGKVGIVLRLLMMLTGQVKYVGRTRQTLRARQLQHWRADKLKNGLQIRAAKLEGKILTGLSYGQSRGLEHYVYKNYVDDGVKLLNKIKPLNLKSTGARVLRVQQYMDDALRFLGRIIL